MVLSNSNLLQTTQIISDVCFTDHATYKRKTYGGREERENKTTTTTTNKHFLKRKRRQEMSASNVTKAGYT